MRGVITGGGRPALPLSGELPELAAVHWRRRVDEQALQRADRCWTLSTVAHEVPFLLVALLLPALDLIMLPVSVAALAFAWVIPALHAARGSGVLRPPRLAPDSGGIAAEQRALGLLADLVGHEARELLCRIGLVIEPGSLGVWVVGPAGALLARPGGRRVQCYCVRATGEELPIADKLAHLLLALRADECGFATVANLTFSGAGWRLARKLSPAAREGLTTAVAIARGRAR